MLRGEKRVLWFVENDIAEKLKAKHGIDLETRLITIEDRKAVHSLHEKDLLRGKGRDPERIVTREDLRELPRHIREPQAVLYDMQTKNSGLLYVFDMDSADRKGKWVVRVNFVDKKKDDISNALRSGGYVKTTDLENEGMFDRLRGSLR